MCWQLNKILRYLRGSLQPHKKKKKEKKNCHLACSSTEQRCWEALGISEQGKTTAMLSVHHSIERTRPTFYFERLRTVWVQPRWHLHYFGGQLKLTGSFVTFDLRDNGAPLYHQGTKALVWWVLNTSKCIPQDYQSNGGCYFRFFLFFVALGAVGYCGGWFKWLHRATSAEDHKTFIRLHLFDRELCHFLLSMSSSSSLWLLLILLFVI